MKKNWWKILSVVLLIYTIIGGLLLYVPALPVVEESIRNLYFHVGMWFSMMILFIISVIHAIRYLSTTDLKYDILSRNYATTGMLLGILGYTTGMIWASSTWVDPNK
jgi:heme exporter protein C